MTVIAAIDGSPAAREVLDRAIAQAKAFDSGLHVIHVFQPPTVVYGMAGAYVFEERALAEAEQKAVWEEAAPVLEATGMTWTRVDLDGYPPAAITRYAREVDANLVVIGTRGRGEFASLVLGSTSHGIIHDSHCDVLVVKNRPEE